MSYKDYNYLSRLLKKNQDSFGIVSELFYIRLLLFYLKIISRFKLNINKLDLSIMNLINIY